MGAKMKRVKLVVDNYIHQDARKKIWKNVWARNQVLEKVRLPVLTVTDDRVRARVEMKMKRK